MKIWMVSFTGRGAETAKKLASELVCGGHAVLCTDAHGTDGFSLSGWTGKAFQEADALVFIGAAGIAVRAAAPFLKSKAEDPAVVVLDENGRFSIPLLSGHLGGAGDLARFCARAVGALLVVTSATDGRGAFAVDLAARRNGCAIVDPERIRHVSGRILNGDTVRFYSDFPVKGALPEGVALSGREGCDICLSVFYRPDEDALHLVPPAAVLGVGRRRGISSQALDDALERFLKQNRVWPQAVSLAASIDLKAEEPGLLRFCRAHGFQFKTYPARVLAAVPGEYSSSAFVRRATGVDNVCERAAVCAGGSLLLPKTAGDGVTMALAALDYTFDFDKGEQL